jgi:hypothetical protein
MIDWIKAKIALLLIGAIWATLFILMLPLLIVAIIYDAKVKTHSDRGWAYSLLIAQDHCVNAILGGHYLTTISAIVGYLQTQQSKTGTLAARFIDLGFKIAAGERNHCVNAMQSDDIYNWSTSRALLGALIYFCGVYALGVLLCN